MSLPILSKVSRLICFGYAIAGASLALNQVAPFVTNASIDQEKIRLLPQSRFLCFFADAVISRLLDSCKHCVGQFFIIWVAHVSFDQ